MIKLRVQEVAKAQGHNISDLQRLTGLSYPGTHALWHNRVTRIDFATLDTLRKALRVNVCELLEAVEEPEEFLDAGLNIKIAPEREPVPAS